MTLIYNYDSDGNFINSQVALVDEFGKEILPENSTYLKPLEEKEGYKVKFDGEKWIYEEISQTEPQPEPTIEEQNEAIRATREQLYVQTSDKLRNDYLEAVARGAENAEELKTAWLESKDKIREENPYIVESAEEVPAEVEANVAEIKENNPYPVEE